MRRLSSEWTGLLQYVFVPVWIGLFGLGVLMAFFAPERVSGLQDDEQRWLLLLIWIVASTVLVFWIGRLAVVDLRGETLDIRRFSTQASVPLTNVASVSASRFSNPERITLTFHSPTPLGDKVTFLPPVRMFAMFTHHPLKAELEAMIDKARGQGR